MTTNQATGKIKASRVNNLAADTYVGPDGQIWYDIATGVLRLGDNVTPGGTIIGGGSGNGVPGGPTNSVQFNAGGDSFGGTVNITTNGTDLSVTGNVNAAYFIGDGSQLTNLPAGNYSNTNVSAYLSSGSVTTDYLTSGNISASGNVSGGYAFFSDIQLNDLSANAILYTDANRNVFNTDFSYDSNTQTMSGVTVSLTGNITANYIIGDGSQLTNLPIQPGEYSNANVAAYLPTYGGDILSATISSGNIIPSADNAYFLGNSTNRWANVWVGPGTIYITDSNIASNATAELTVLNGELLVNGVPGITANLISGTSTLTIVPDGNLRLNAGGGPAELVVSPTATNITGNLIVSGNITGNIDLIGNVSTLINGTTSIVLAPSGNIAMTVAGASNVWTIGPTGVLTSANFTGQGNVNALGFSTGNIYITDSTITNQTANANIDIYTSGSGQVHVNADGFQVQTTTNPDPVFSVSNSGEVNILAPSFPGNIGAVNIVGSSNGNFLAPQNLGVMLHLTGQDGSQSRVYNDATNNYAAYVGRRTNGTITSPTQVLSGNIVSRIGATPYANGGWPTKSTSRIDFVANQNQTANNQGIDIEFWTTPSNSNVVNKVITLGNSGIYFNDSTFQSTAGIPLTQRGNALGVATLDSAGLVPLAQLPITGATVYKGTYDASTNTPTLVNGVGTAGWQYAVVVAGTQNFGAGPVVMNIGDFVIYDGATWNDIPLGGSGVTSFNTRTGAVTLSSADIGNALGYTAYNGNTNPNGYVNSAQAANAAPVQNFNSRIGNITLLSSDVTNALTAGSLVNAKLQNSNIIIGNITANLGDTVTNITGLTSVSSASLVGNVTGATVSVTGNISGNYFFGNGSQLTGIATGIPTQIVNGTSNVTVGSSGSNITIGVGGTNNVAVFATAGANITSIGVGTAPSGTAGEIRAINDITAFYSSDSKFKENIQTIPNAIDAVVAIGGKTFNWNDNYLDNRGGEDSYFVQKSDFGVIAQDVQRAFPLAVRTRPDGSLAVDYAKLVALAFAAIAELQTEIISLKNKI